MKKYQVLHAGNLIYQEVREAVSLFERMKGLMFQKEIEESSGLIIENCNSIHTFFMNFSIDAIFLDKNNLIVKKVDNLNPWRITRFYFSAKKVLEVKGGSFPTKIGPGEELEILCIN